MNNAVEFIFRDISGNDYSTNGSGISQLIAGSLTYNVDDYVWDNKLVDNTFLPGAVKLGNSRIKSRIVPFTCSFTFTTDSAFRTAINAFLKAFNSVYYLIDNTNDLRVKVAPGHYSIQHEKGSFRRHGSITFELDFLNPYWEDLLEKSVTSHCPATAYTNIPTHVLGALLPQPRLLIDSNKYTQHGNTLSTNNPITKPHICAMSPTQIAYFDTTTLALRVYTYSAPTWSIGAGPLSLVSNGEGPMDWLISGDIAMLSYTGKSIQAYRYTASWATLGSAFAFTPNTVTVADVCALTSTDVVVVWYSVTDGKTWLTRLTFNGSTWSVVGTPLQIASIATTPKVTMLTTTKIAVYDGTAKTVQAYTTDGATFTALGNLFDSTLYANGEGDIEATDATYTGDFTVIIWGATTGVLNRLAFDGTNWRLFGSTSTGIVNGTGTASIAFLSSLVIAVINESTHLLARYLLDVGGTAPTLEFYAPINSETLSMLVSLFGTTVYVEMVINNENGTVTINALSIENFIDSATGFLELDDGMSYLRVFPSQNVSVTVAYRERYYV